MLADSSQTLASWFSSIYPWSIENEKSIPGHLVWLSFVGVPLHAWTSSNFTALACLFGQVMEVEDWTLNRDQVHIGRVLVLSSIERTINDVVCLNVEQQVFSVRILEDVAEIIDFGPRYDLDVAQSEVSADVGSDNGDDWMNELLDVNSVDESSPVLQGKAKSHRKLNLK